MQSYKRYVIYAFLIITTVLLLAGCGNGYYYNRPAAFDEYRLHLGESINEVGAQAEGMAGACRATADDPAAIVNNPAGLAHLDRFTVEGGFAFANRALSVEADTSAPAQSNAISFNGSYAAAGLPLLGGRIALGAAYWTPFDFRGELGEDEDSGRIASSGGLHAVSPALAVSLGPVRVGISPDILFGGQTYEVYNDASEQPFDYSFTGYDLRVGIQAGGRLNRKIALEFGATGRLGACTDMGGYEMNYAPNAGVGLALHYGPLSGEADFVYTFAEEMSTTEPGADNALDSVAENTYYACAGGSYDLGTAVVRAGYGYKPRLFNDAGSGRVSGKFYTLGGGWESFGGRGRIDTSLRYGTRGSLNSNLFSTSYISFNLVAVVGF
ncbi:MAG: hypothetical protein GY771_05545 [bacterium]|nr:hypothetical protein [bacterium]